MSDIRKNTANSIMVRMLDSADHLSGETGLTLSVSLSKAGGGFAAISPVVTERGTGWYNIDLTTAHCDTLGELVVMVTALDADPSFKILNVVEYLSITVSEVSICNTALARCGVTRFIQSISEESTQADVLNLFYAQVRDRVLQAYNWPFAKRYAVLADIGNPPSSWAYCYQYPSGCLKVRNIVVDGNRSPLKSQRIPYEIVFNESGVGSAILTDQPTASIEYTTRVTDVNTFTSAFTNALSWALAAEIAMPLTADANRSKLALSMYITSIQESDSISQGEREEDQYPTSEFLTARL